MNKFLTALVSASAFFACDSTRTPRETCSDPNFEGTYFAGAIRATIAQERTRNLFRLPKVAANEIHRATESALCARAETELASLKTEPTKGPPHKFYVFRVGTSFAIGEETPEQDADVLYFFDPEWRMLSTGIVQ
jgi:hypothetical protein